MAQSIEEQLGIDPNDEKIARAADNAEATFAFKEALIKARKASGKTQNDIAEALGISQREVAFFENISTDGTLSEIRKYANVIGAKIGFTVSS